MQTINNPSNNLKQYTAYIIFLGVWKGLYVMVGIDAIMWGYETEANVRLAPLLWMDDICLIHHKLYKPQDIYD